MTEIKKSMPAASAHSVNVENRNNMSVTGVTDVSDFSEDKAEILTTMGKLTVKGKKLNVNTLNIGSGELKLTGEIKSWDYTDTRGRGGLFSGLFS